MLRQRKKKTMALPSCPHFLCIYTVEGHSMGTGHINIVTGHIHIVTGHINMSEQKRTQSSFKYNTMSSQMKFINTDVIHSDRKWGKLTKKINITLFHIKAFIVTGSFQLLIFWWWRKLLFDVAMPSLSFTPYSYSTTPPPPIIFPPPPWGICSNRSSLPNNLATLKSLQTHEH